MTMTAASSSSTLRRLFGSVSTERRISSSASTANCFPLMQQHPQQQQHQKQQQQQQQCQLRRLDDDIPPRLPIFVGQQKLLLHMRQLLERHERILFLVGADGLGKSSAALELVHQLKSSDVAKSHPLTVRWMAAGVDEQLERDWMRLADALHIDPSGLPFAELVGCVGNALLDTINGDDDDDDENDGDNNTNSADEHRGRSSRLLFVFDDVRRYAAIEPLVNSLPPGVQLIVTSCNAAIASSYAGAAGATVVRLTPLTRADADQYVSRCLASLASPIGNVAGPRIAALLKSSAVLGASDEVTPHRLRRAVGCLVRMSADSASQLLGEAASPSQSLSPPTQPLEDEAFVRVKTHQPTAFKALECFAYLYGEHIGADIVHGIWRNVAGAALEVESTSAFFAATTTTGSSKKVVAATHTAAASSTSTSTSASTAKESLSLLADWSLLELTSADGSVRVHRLVQEELQTFQARHSTTCTDKELILALLVEVVGELLPEPNKHSLVGDLLRRNGGVYVQAVELIKRVHELCRLKTDTLVSRIGRQKLVHRVALYELFATQRFERANVRLLVAHELATTRAFRGIAHPTVAQCLQHLALSYDRLDDDRRALNCRQQAFKMRKQIYNKAIHPDIADSLHSIGISHVRLGNKKLGIEHLKKALNMRRQLYAASSGDSSHAADLAHTLYSLAMCLAESEMDDDDDEDDVEKVKGEQASIDKHGSSSSSSNADNKRAFELDKEACEMRARLYAHTPHPDLALSLYALAVAHERKNEDRTALDYYQRAHELRVQLYRERSHAEVAHSLNALAVCYSRLGEDAQALHYDLAALAMRHRLRSTNSARSSDADSRTAESLYSIGLAYEKLGDDRAALVYLREACAIRERLLSNNSSSAASVELAASLGALGISYARNGDDPTALAYKQRSLDMYRRLRPGGVHADVANALHSVALSCERLGDEQGAARLLDEESRVRQQLLAVAVTTTVNNKSSGTGPKDRRNNKPVSKVATARVVNLRATAKKNNIKKSNS